MKNAEQLHFSEGEILLIDKPLGWSSFDVVRKVKYLTRAKTGHSGTLDPLATGLLLIATGPFTKKLTALQGLSKEYTGRFFIGATTPSYDRESEPGNEQDISALKEEDYLKAAKTLTGEMAQVPPVFSAVKINGTRSYKLARKGEAPIPDARQVTIYAFDITEIAPPFISFRVSCSKGTYIRSLASDYGHILGTGAYLHDLRRTKVGDYDVADAWEIEELANQLNTIKQNARNADEDIQKP